MTDLELVNDTMEKLHKVYKENTQELEARYIYDGARVNEGVCILIEKLKHMKEFIEEEIKND